MLGYGGAHIAGEGVADFFLGLAVGEGGELGCCGVVVGALQVLDGLAGGFGLLVVASALVPASGEDRCPDEGGEQDGEGAAVLAVGGVDDVAGGVAKAGCGAVIGADLGALGAGERPGGGS